MTLRLLPWPSEGGRPVYLSAQHEGSFVSRVADDLESAQLDMAGELLRSTETDTWKRQLAGSGAEVSGLVESLSAALRDVIRIAESRTMRPPVADDTEADVVDTMMRQDGDGSPDAAERPGEREIVESYGDGAEAVTVEETGELVVRRWWPEAQYVSKARRLLSLQLTVWGMADLADSAALVLSELHGNAVRHARIPDEGLIETRFERLPDGRLRIEVHDADGAKPELLHLAADAESGRGLGMVDAVTGGRWGVSGRNGPGKMVWAECSTTDRAL